MGAIAGPNLIVLMLTAMEHDLTYRVNYKMDTRMQVSMQSISLGNQKSALYQQMSQCDQNTTFGKQEYQRLLSLASGIESKERVIAAIDKQLEMELTKLQNELKMVQQRKESAQKMLDQNIKTAFSYG